MKKLIHWRTLIGLLVLVAVPLSLPIPCFSQYNAGALPAGCASPSTGAITCTGTVTGNIGSWNSEGTNFTDIACAAQSVGNSNQDRLSCDGTNWPVVSMNSNAAQKLGLSMGVNAQTVGYTAVQSDCGKLITMNGVSLTFTLPAAIINSACVFDVKNLAATSLTIARNGLNVDGAASNPTALTQNQSYRITNDGAGYWTEALQSGTAGAVTTTGSPANTDCAIFSAAATITGVAGCTIDGSGNITAVGNITQAAGATFGVASGAGPIILTNSGQFATVDSNTNGGNGLIIRGGLFHVTIGSSNSAVFTVDSATGLVTTYDGLTVVGNGVSSVQAAPTAITIGSGTSIGSTQLCATAVCPAGTYTVSVYVDITTPCGTSGTYVVNLIYTDDQGSKTIVVNINGTGAVPATGTLTTTSTANYGENSQVIRVASADINYSTTATACGTAGPMVGKLYFVVTRLS